MLRKWLMGGPVLSRGVVRTVAALYVLMYALVYAKAGALLPEFIFRDADKIQAQMGGADTYAGTSFDAVGRFYAMFGPLVDALVIGIGACFIWAMLCRANRPGLMAAALVLSVPCVFFNLFVASKDTLVVLISLFVAHAARRDNPRRAMLTALLCYGAYAALVRSYFALIAAIGFGAYAWRNCPLQWRLAGAATALLAVFLLPGSVYVALLHSRDMAVDYLVYQSPYGARTSFYNPLDPSSFTGFVGDYLYALGRLNLAWLFSPGIKELAMQLFIVLAVGPALGQPQASRAKTLLGCFVIGHVAVSMLFEPDLGSYTRHLSSVALYSMTALSAARRRAGGSRAAAAVPGAG
ncbi:hypothetical protein WS67_04520 [Burkholderia singularis]|uniref:Uncharacterized protein n=1 Tax=Burkholderia singularis TaxID=1503053 RepID=A0A103E6U7_9BURK|nr:hypothetical protein [Burkholderia singularis]KVE29457.1 hypothetical protein WS67_04520 [Burkholderia singularis]